MTNNYDDLSVAQEQVKNIHQILQKAKETHSHSEYLAMSVPFYWEKKVANSLQNKFNSLDQATKTTLMVIFGLPILLTGDRDPYRILIKKYVHEPVQRYVNDQRINKKRKRVSWPW